MAKDILNPYIPQIEALGDAYNLHKEAIEAGSLNNEQLQLMEKLAAEGTQISPEALAKFTVTDTSKKSRKSVLQIKIESFWNH